MLHTSTSQVLVKSLTDCNFTSCTSKAVSTTNSCNKQIHSETDRQTDRQIDRRTDRQTDRRMDGQTDRVSCHGLAWYSEHTTAVYSSECPLVVPVTAWTVSPPTEANTDHCNDISTLYNCSLHHSSFIIISMCIQSPQLIDDTTEYNKNKYQPVKSSVKCVFKSLLKLSVSQQNSQFNRTLSITLSQSMACTLYTEKYHIFHHTLFPSQ